MSDIDDRIKSEALNWLVSLRGTAEKAQNFVLDQAPDALRELVALGRVEWTSAVLISGVAIILGIHLLRKSIWADYSDFDRDDRDLVNVAAVMGSFAVLIAGIFGLLGNFHSCATAWFAPRIYVIETLAGLASKAVGK